MSDEIFLYLTTIGRKTGEPRHIEIWFAEYSGRYYMVSEGRQNAHWVKNILHHPQVTFSVGTRADHEASLPSTTARGRAIDPDLEPEIAQEVRTRFDQKYQWSEGLIMELTPEGLKL